MHPLTDRAPPFAWGKAEWLDGPRAYAFHTLAAHCIDVAATFEAMLSCDGLRRRLARGAGLEDFTPVQRARLTVLAGLHDIGKANLGFFGKLMTPEARAAHGFPRLDAFGHGQPVLGLLEGAGIQALDLRAFDQWMDRPGGALAFLLATASHHGRPVTISRIHPDRVRWRALAKLWDDLPRLPYRPRDEAAALRKGLLTCWPEAAMGGAQDKLPSNPSFLHDFLGLVMAADWIGSMTESGGARFFTFSDNPAAKDRLPQAREAARRALAEIGVSFTGPSIGLDRPSFPQATGLPAGELPNAMQRQVQALPLPGRKSLVILESETGSGKTEAALLHFARLNAKGLVGGLYFALPTRAAAVQIHERVRKAVKSLFADAPPPVVLALPGYLRVDEAEGKKLPDSWKVHWDDENLGARSWAAENSKRYMAAPIVVGTIDQALCAVIRTKHAQMRSMLLHRLLLVIDEVHASDAYMTHLQQRLIDLHLAHDGHAFLMSATLGAAARCDYLREKLPPPDEAEKTLYPALWLHNDEAAPRFIEIERDDEIEQDDKRRSKRVRHDLRPWRDDPRQVAKTALDAALRGNAVLVIRNTVALAIATQEALEELAAERNCPHLLAHAGEKDRVFPMVHHSRFDADARRLLDDAVEGIFGKDGKRGGCVLTATQTVEQSLDIDADVLITDLAPMDVLLQRIGRLWRHPGNNGRRPGGTDAAPCVILTPKDGVDGIGLQRGLDGVYRDARIAAATLEALQDQTELLIPEMNRILVERSIHPDKLEALAQRMGEQWLRHGTDIEGGKIAEQNEANHAVLDRSFGFLDGNQPADEDAKAATRLGLKDRMAVFPEPVQGPFGPFTQIRIPAHLLDAGAMQQAELQPVMIEKTDAASGCAIRFDFGNTRYLYDRKGLRKL